MNHNASSHTTNQAASPTTPDPSLIGKVGANSTGRVGVITDIKALPWGITYVGINVFDGTRWAGSNPAIVADTVADFIRRCEKVAYEKGRDNRPLIEAPLYILNANVN